MARSYSRSASDPMSTDLFTKWAELAFKIRFATFSLASPQRQREFRAGDLIHNRLTHMAEDVGYRPFHQLKSDPQEHQHHAALSLGTHPRSLPFSRLSSLRRLARS